MTPTSNNPFVETVYQYIDLCHGIDPAIGVPLEGVTLWRLGDLARDNGVTRWKRAPGNTGANAATVELMLSGKGLVIYSQHGNVAAGTNGTIMTTNTLRHLHADDYVIVLDIHFDTARQLKEGSFEFAEPFDPTALVGYRGDQIRSGNYNDALQVCKDILLPMVMPTR